MTKEKEPSSLVVKVRFKFAGPVSTKELHDALKRAFSTKQFRLRGTYAIVETEEEVGLEEERPMVEAPPGAGATGGYIDVATAYKR